MSTRELFEQFMVHEKSAITHVRIWTPKQETKQKQKNVPASLNGSNYST